jgi:hypothetical protein
MRRFGRALWTALFGWALIGATIYIHALRVFGVERGYLDGGSYPLTPSIRVTAGSLAVDSIMAGVPFVIAAVTLGLLPARRLQLWALAGTYLCLWLFAAEGVAEIFAFDFGTTWQTGEPFRELFLRPILTPALCLSGLFVFVLGLVYQQCRAKAVALPGSEGAGRP